MQQQPRTEVGDVLIIINVNFPLCPLEIQLFMNLCRVILSPEGREPAQPSWLRCASSGGCEPGAQRSSARSAAERAQGPSGGEMAEFQFLRPESLVARVKSERRKLECKLRAAETSWRENGCDLGTAQSRPNALYNCSLYREAFFCPSWRKCGVRAFPRIALLLPSFLFSEIFFLAANNAEGVGKRNPKQQKIPPH